MKAKIKFQVIDLKINGEVCENDGNFIYSGNAPAAPCTLPICSHTLELDGYFESGAGAKEMDFFAKKIEIKDHLSSGRSDVINIELNEAIGLSLKRSYKDIDLDPDIEDWLK